MGWTHTSSVWTQAGTTRSFVRVATPIPNPGEVKISSKDFGDELSIVIRADDDGRTGWEIAIEGNDLLIRKRVFNITQTASATAPHYLSSNERFDLRVRVNGTSIKAAVINAAGAVQEIEYDTTDRSGVTTWGFASAIDGATASSVFISGLREIVTTVSEVIYWLQGGTLYACYNGQTATLIAQGLFAASDNVQTATLDGVAYFVGNGKARKADLVARTTANWTPTAGTLPGQTSAGTTTATLITTLLGSLVLSGDPNTPLAIYGSASGEPDNWDLADLASGHAWAYGVGDSASVGDPITCIAQGPANTLFVGCTNSINFLLGNPFEGTGEIVTRSNTYGASGPNAAVLVGTPGGSDVIAFHAPQSIMLAPFEGAPIPVSIDTLTEYIAFDAADRANVRVTLARDPERRMLHIFVTGDNRTVYVSYAENIGGYQIGGRGYYPITLPVVPTCAVIWRGKVVLGTEADGLCVFDQENGDDLGETRTTIIPAHLIHSGPIESDAIIKRLAFFLKDDGAGASVRIYGGRTPRAAYDDPQLLAGSYAITPTSWALSVNARAPAMVLQFISTEADPFSVEAIDCDFETARLSRRMNQVAASAAPAISTPPAIPAAPGDPGDAPDGPGPGTLPDGNDDPDDTPVPEALKLPFPPKYDGGFSVPFDAPFWGMFDYDGFGPSRVVTAPPMEYVLDYGDPEPGGGIVRGVQNRHANTFDRGPSRFGPGVKIDTLKPTYVIVADNQGGIGPVITEAPGFEPWGGGASQ